MQPLLLLLGFILLPGAQAGFLKPPTCTAGSRAEVKSPEGLSSCGGFLVREDFVMTAGHCWGSAINVTLGAHNIEKQERTQQQVTVLRAIRHPKYNETNALNDIMLLQLRNRVTRNRFVRPVALPKAREKPRPGALCTVAGWGWVNLHRWSDKLQDVQLRVQRDRKCTCRFPSYNSQTQICVGDPRQRKAAFKGDSGGPLVCNNVVQGIVSYGDKEHGTTPEVFTRISSYLPWINKTMRCFQSAAAD